MSFHDLNVTWTPNDPELPRTLSFLAELGYATIALTHTLPTPTLPSPLISAIPTPLPIPTPPNLRILRRLTIPLTSTSLNLRLPSTHPHYDLLALRPTTEQTFQHACLTLDCDLISLDLTQRHPYPFKSKPLNAAIARGVKIELCYAAALSKDAAAKRNLISNAASLIRATRGRGLVLSSEAGTALCCRGPWDAMNLAVVWGLSEERAREAVVEEARRVVVGARLKRTSFRAVVDVVYAGEKPKGEPGAKGKGKAGGENAQKRKADMLGGTLAAVKGGEEGMVLSKRARKKQAALERLEFEKRAGEAGKA